MKKIVFSLIAILAVAFISCEKENLISNEEKEIVANDEAIESAVDEAVYEVDLYSESTAIIDYLAANQKSDIKGGFFGGRYKLGHAPLVIIERVDGAFPVTITLNYGEGTELKNGRVLSGKIITVISDRPRTLNATRTTTLEDFYVDDVNIAGTRTATFQAGEGNLPQVSIESLFTVTFPDGVVFTREAEKLRTFVEGFDTPREFADNVFHITGFVNLSDENGSVRSKTILEPLVRKGDCKFFVSGIVKMVKADGTIFEINYGDGTCDDIATVTKGDETFQITLGKHNHNKD